METMMISEEEAREKEEELKRRDRMANPSRPELSRSKPIADIHRPGRCYVCGCKVYRTEIICGQCACEDDRL